ncbi:hypothetical protein KBC86_01780 [Candidatus Gracilibacteria bacterium]|nr:hypothetical protein [Candidatus Gracilibacteria bacterium]
MRFLLILSLSFLLISCSQKATEVPPVNPVSTGTTTEPIKKDPNQALIDAAVSDHTMVFDGLEPKTLKVYHTAGTQTKVTFNNYDANSMVVSLDFLEDQKPNLRLSRIRMPDGTIDGPFSVKTGYNLYQKGEYELIFNENQMSGDPWSGVVDITIAPSRERYSENTILFP